MTDRQRDALARLSDSHCLPFKGEALNVSQAFANTHPLVLEIGCGMGESTAAIARDNPQTNYLGIEVYPAGVGSLLLHIEQMSLRNLKLIQHDAIEVLREMIQPGSLSGLHVFFPDPWPKKRHHKRRLIQPAFVSLACSRLAPDAVFHCATDWEPYAEQMLQVLSAEPGLRNRSETGSYHSRPASRPQTKFEQRGLRLGHRVRDLIFTRQPS